MTKVSVIMSVYNADNYDVLLASVKSILNQSFRDFEFIICNDGSSNTQTEKYLSIIKNLDPRIRIIGYKKNMGLAYSRNQCIKVCQGKYIAFQDYDDISAPDRLK
ncbi:glycosyltransferase family 2 protein, partial [Streptomyces scabiei]